MVERQGDHDRDLKRVKRRKGGGERESDWSNSEPNLIFCPNLDQLYPKH